MTVETPMSTEKSEDFRDANAMIGDTVYNPERLKPLKEEDCRIPIPAPSFYLIGAAKCGSTTLATVLHTHPDCCFSAPKETNFFTRNFELGWDWFRGAFAHYNGEPIVGEGSVSNAGMPHLKNPVQLLHGYTPDAKFVYIVRNPYEKLVSGWKMALSGPGFLGHKSAKKGFEQYVLHEEDRHPYGGEWSNPTHGWDAATPSADNRTRVWLDGLNFEEHVNQYLRVFPKEQIKVMFLEDWKANEDAECRSLCEFVGLDPSKLPKEQKGPVNRADQRVQTMPLFKLLADSDFLRPIRHLFPQSLRTTLRTALRKSPLGTRKLVYPDLTMSDEFRNNLREYLKTKSASFLKSQGKPETFWDFDKIK